MEKAYRVKMTQEVSWYMHVLAEGEPEAMAKALEHAVNGERLPDDEDMVRGEIESESASLVLP